MRSASNGSDDLTARAAIRNAALRLFADHGPDAVTVRRIAAAAGVSPALVVHHFGSKAGLREAVDAHVIDLIDGLLDGGQGAELGEVFARGSARSLGEMFAEVFPPDSPVPGYLRRLLLAGEPVGLEVFRSWFAVTRRVLDEMTETGLARESADPDVRAAYLLLGDVALLVLRQPLADVLGFDPLSPEGIARWAAQVAEITRRGMLLPPPDEEGNQR